jgi:hypothetical protein
MTRPQATATADPEAGSALVSPQRRNFVFLAIVLGMLLAALDQTIVATALPTIVADLVGRAISRGLSPAICWPRRSSPRWSGDSVICSAAS